MRSAPLFSAPDARAPSARAPSAPEPPAPEPRRSGLQFTSSHGRLSAAGVLRKSSGGQGPMVPPNRRRPVARILLCAPNGRCSQEKSVTIQGPRGKNRPKCMSPPLERGTTRTRNRGQVTLASSPFSRFASRWAKVPASSRLLGWSERPSQTRVRDQNIHFGRFLPDMDHVGSFVPPRTVSVVPSFSPRAVYQLDALAGILEGQEIIEDADAPRGSGHRRLPWTTKPGFPRTRPPLAMPGISYPGRKLAPSPTARPDTPGRRMPPSPTSSTGLPGRKVTPSPTSWSSRA